MVPGPGSFVPRTAEISPAEIIPCAMIWRNSVVDAYAGSRCAGLTSPETNANSSMSCCVTVCVILAVSPTSISAKVRFSITAPLLGPRPVAVTNAILLSCGRGTAPVSLRAPPIARRMLESDSNRLYNGGDLILLEKSPARIAALDELRGYQRAEQPLHDLQHVAEVIHAVVMVPLQPARLGPRHGVELRRLRGVELRAPLDGFHTEPLLGHAGAARRRGKGGDAIGRTADRQVVIQPPLRGGRGLQGSSPPPARVGPNVVSRRRRRRRIDVPGTADLHQRSSNPAGLSVTRPARCT